MLARLGLRSILEARVTLQYLETKDEPSLWSDYRTYGAGQAKLAFLKLDDDEAEQVGFVNTSLLSAIANEDQSLDFVPINLGNWGNTNLRQMSEVGGVKAEYDRFYPWASGYTHGNWAAIRSVCFDICMNALHRAHRVLRDSPAPLDDVIADACELTDAILHSVDRLYGPFVERVSVQSPPAAT